MKIKVAETAGFCYGVNRAVEMIYALLKKGKKVATLGAVIHNPQVVADLEKQGVLTVHSVGEVPEGYTVLLRAHGATVSDLREIEMRRLEAADATCPFVERIHTIAKNAKDENKPLFIAGDANHPEVKGIVSRYEDGGRVKAVIVKGAEEIEEIIKNDSESEKKEVVMVAQTTFNTEEWDKSAKTIKKLCTKADVFDTICNATATRQAEARRLAEDSDVMIIVGGKESSNTAKLYEICKSYCTSCLIESADELPVAELAKQPENVKVGITAGASTPVTTIKEVLVTMTDNNPSAQSFEEMLEESLKKLNTDEKVHGVVVSITPTEVYVDVGRKQAGFIPVEELSQDPNVKPEDVVKVGDEVDLLIMKTNDQEGTIMLSKRRVDAMKGWDELEDAIESKEVLSGKVIEVVKGGVIVLRDALRVFIPASQATLTRGEDLEELKNKEVGFRILEVDRKRRRAVGSIRSVLNDERKAAQEKVWESINEGDKFTGKVKSLTKFGAFVDIGGVDGMVHISELAWNRIKHPSEVLNVGDTVNVYVKSLDRENHKISLGYKDPADNPWEKLRNEFPVGTVAKARIVGMTPFGAFANIIPGIDGLIHISQIADHRIEKPQDVLKVGDEVEARVTEIDFDKNRVSLSIRVLLDEAKAEADAQAEEKQEDAVVYEAGPDAHIGTAPEDDDAPTAVPDAPEQDDVQAAVEAEMSDDQPYVTEIDKGVDETDDELANTVTPAVEAEEESAEKSEEAPVAEEKPKRKRRTKAEIEADKTAAEAAKAAEEKAEE